MAPSRSKSAAAFLSGGNASQKLVDSVLNALPSPHSRRSYARGIADLFAYAEGRPISPELLLEWRMSMAGAKSTKTVNLRVTAVRALIQAAHRQRHIDAQQAWELLEVGGLPSRGVRMGNWLTEPQLRRLLSVPNRKTLRGARNYCILAILAGCAIRLDELARLDLDTIQQREGRWVLVDLVGKGGRVRTVAIPVWVKQAIDGWVRLAKIKEGRLVRQLTLKPEGLSNEGIRDIVTKAAEKTGVKNFGPHDLRRTCAKLCREAGGDLEQIQAMLGHANIETTQHYLGTIQNLKNAVNDRLSF
jgi:integrase